MNDRKEQKLLNELCKDNMLKEVKLVNGLLKYKQNQMYELEGKLRLLDLNNEYDRPIVDHREEKTTVAVVSRRCFWLQFL